MVRREIVLPTQRAGDGVLYRRVRTQKVIERAWRHVHVRASLSKNPETRKGAAQIYEASSSYLRGIIEQLRARKFKFQPQKGIVKKRPGKKSRPLVAAPILNRIVQRAVLDVCQSTGPTIKNSLGRLPDVLATPTSVGGLKGRGVGTAIDLIRTAISGGATWYVRSDLKEFFRSINKSAVREFLSGNIADRDFTDLFMMALATELDNEDEVRADLDLFPLGEEGVPQGSALSALCANVVLNNFDREMNKRGVTTIRYLDDFVILGSSKRSVELAWRQGKELLSASGFEAHDPSEGTGKASFGAVSDGFDFLSLSVRGASIRPSATAQNRLMEEIETVIRAAKFNISNLGAAPRRSDRAFYQSISQIDAKVRGWGDAFSSTTDRLVFTQMDKRIDQLVSRYLRWFDRVIRDLPMQVRRRKQGIALLADTKAPLIEGDQRNNQVRSSWRRDIADVQ